MLTVLLVCLLQVDTLSAAQITDKQTTVSFVEEVKTEDLSFHSVGEAISLIPDIQIADYGPSGAKYASGRGLGTAHTGVFLDGVLVRDVQNNQTDLSKFDLSNLSTISVFNGQKFSMLAPASSYAYGTSIYLKSRLDYNRSYSARLEYGSFNTLFANIHANQPIGEHILSADLNYNNTDGYRENSDLVKYSAELNYKFKGLALKAKYSNSEFGTPGSTSWLSDGRQLDRNTLIQASYDKIWDKVAISFAGKYSNDFMSYKDSWSDNDYKLQSGYTSAVLGYNPVSWLDLSVASDLQITDMLCNVEEYPRVQRYNSTNTFNFKFSGEKVAFHTTILYNYVKDNEVNWSNFAPAFTLSYSDNSLDLFLSYKEIFRVPNMNELYYPYYSNKDLRSENVSQVDLGFKEILGKFSVSSDLYINHVTDKILSIEPLYIPTNYQSVYGHGITSFVSYETFKGNWNLNMKVSHSYEESLSDGKSIPYIPKHTITLNSLVKYKSWSLLLTDVFKSSSVDACQSLVSPYNVLNASLEYTFKCKTPIKFGVNCYNILNEKYEVVPGYPMPGISILGKISITI